MARKAKYKDSRNLNSNCKRFVLDRKVDSTGNSGTGIVAEGCQFSNGRVAMTWLSHLGCVNIYDSIEVVRQLHGHNGDTDIVWCDEPKE